MFCAISGLRRFREALKEMEEISASPDPHRPSKKPVRRARRQ